MAHAGSAGQRTMRLAFGPANERIAAAPQRGKPVLGSSDGQRDTLQIIHGPQPSPSATMPADSASEGVNRAGGHLWGDRASLAG